MRAALLTLLLFLSLDASARDRNEVWRFRKTHPCPSTGHVRGACPGYQVDHVNPLKCGGADRPSNMQWLTIAAHKAKTRAETRQCHKPRR